MIVRPPLDSGRGATGRPAARAAPEPATGLFLALRDAGSFLVQPGERVLGVGKILVGRGAESLDGGSDVLRHHLPLNVEQREVIGGGRVAPLGRGLEVAGGGGGGGPGGGGGA